MRIVLTGADGFLGWHTRLRLNADGQHEIRAIGRNSWSSLGQAVYDADAVIHIAGSNRGTGEAVRLGNADLARDVASAVQQASGPVRIIYANSIQHGNGTPYGNGKAQGRNILQEATVATGGHLVDVRLPNLFGQHGRPYYNSFVATFVNAVLTGERPQVDDKSVSLLHAQRAADVLVDSLTTAKRRLEPRGTPIQVAKVLALLQEFHRLYRRGGIPDLSNAFRLDLFNTYRTAAFEHRQAIPLTSHADRRGQFIEAVRAHGGQGLTSFSTTAPGMTRGNHYHLHKVERFVVLQGEATISLRRMFQNKVVQVYVSGARPQAVDMPTGWTHCITNTGRKDLLTLFWAHELFDPAAPDTYPSEVKMEGHA